MTRKKTKGKEMIKKEETPVPSTRVMDFNADAGQGFEGTDKDSFAIPFLVILQSNNPQVDEDDERYIKGAKAGMLLNTVTEEIYNGKKGVKIIPCYYQHMLVEWVPRDAGGGFRGQYPPKSINLAKLERDTSGKFLMENGNYLADTRYHYVLVVNKNGTFTPVIISLTSTQIKKSRNWITRMDNLKVKNAEGRLITPPMYSHFYIIHTMNEENDKGKWKGWKFTTDVMLKKEQSDLYFAAQDFYKLIKKGAVQMVTPTDTDTEEVPF